MAGDYGRLSFDAVRDFAGVLIQQGHPILDSDWNELVAIVGRRMRAGTVDAIGRAVVPRETPHGFEIKLSGGALSIGRGRMYVDGLLAECHGRMGPDAAPVLDRARLVDGVAAGVLDEMISQEPNDFVAYDAQPYLPAAPASPSGAGPHLAYLDVWRREVTPLKDPRLLEPALRGIDTATRWQTVWQVRLLADVGQGATCGTALAAWDALVAPSPARLTTATIEVEDPEEPCLIPPGGGYRGLENQLYRVEIHAGGALGAARFKWSRDNASVGATVESAPDPKRLVVRRIGRDSVLRFATGDWVEVTDDRREFAGLSGDMRRVTVFEDLNELRFETALSADLLPSNAEGDTAADRHLRVVKWDQRGKVMLADGATHANLDDAASDGLIPVPANGAAVVLEAGITVSFTTAPAGGALRACDHWCFAARTETAAIEILTEAPPLGVHHHYARLAVVSFPSSVSDCRVFWPPLAGDGEGHDCGCTVCVSAEDHNSGLRTIQKAIDSLPEEGGTVCLGPGGYALGEDRIRIVDRKSVRLRGHGGGSLLAYAGEGGAVLVMDSEDVRISDVGVVAVDVKGPDAKTPTAGVHLLNDAKVTIEDCAIAVFSKEGGEGIGLALEGWQLGLDVSRNVMLAPDAISALAAARREGGRGYCALLDVSVSGNVLLGQKRGVALDGQVLHLGPVELVSNVILAAETGVVATGAGFSTEGGGEAGGKAGEPWSFAALTLRDNAIGFARDGVVSGVPDLQLLDNEIVGGEGKTKEAPGACVRLVAGASPVPTPDGKLIGNRLGRTEGAGVTIEAPQASLIVKQNVVRDCAAGGVIAGPDVTIETLAFDNNLIERVGARPRDKTSAAARFGAVSEARILGNHVRDVGGRDGAAVIGFDLGGAAALDFAHNVVAPNAPPGSPRPVIGVLLSGALGLCDLSSNRIFDETAEGDPASWCAIMVDGRFADREREDWRRAALPAYVARGAEAFVVLANGPRRFAALGEAEIRVSGNLVSDAHEGSELPLVQIRCDLKLTSAAIFAENQCALAAPGKAEAIVDIAAPRIVAANNVVRRRSDALSMRLACQSDGKTPYATVLGNLVYGKIYVNGDDVPTPFFPLNVMVP